MHLVLRLHHARRVRVDDLPVVTARNAEKAVPRGLRLARRDREILPRGRLSEPCRRRWGDPRRAHLAEQRVEQGGLAYVRHADDRDVSRAMRLRRRLCARLGRRAARRLGASRQRSATQEAEVRENSRGNAQAVGDMASTTAGEQQQQCG